MKYAALQIGVLTIVTIATVGLARGLVAHWWGPAGLTLLYAAAAICLVAAALAAVPLGLVATHRPALTPHMAFAGTGIRLVVTTAVGLAYQFAVRPAPVPFLACLVGIYLVLLLAETALIVYIVLRVFARRGADAR